MRSRSLGEAEGDYTYGMDILTAAPYTSPVDPRRSFTTWLEIDLGAIEQNAQALRAATPAQLMAVVKANAYGHGAIEAALAAERGGASWLGVARPSEALELRGAGLELPVLILGPAPEGRLPALIANEVSLTVSDEPQIDQAAAAAAVEGAAARVHLKLDTGMSRLGAAPEAATRLARKLGESDHVSFEGLFTHLARADEPESPTTQAQIRIFEEALTALEAEGLRPEWVHAANSAATLMHPESHFDLVRCGIALYGLHPSDSCQLPDTFRAALQWKAKLTRVRELPPGTGVSYGHDYVTSATERIGTMQVGYADGLRRLDGNTVLVRDSSGPVVGRVCMDLCMLQLDAAPDARVGDEVVLIGRQGEVEIRAEQVARLWGTINYEVTSAIASRVTRLYH